MMKNLSKQELINYIKEVKFLINERNVLSKQIRSRSILNRIIRYGSYKNYEKLITFDSNNETFELLKPYISKEVKEFLVLSPEIRKQVFEHIVRCKKIRFDTYQTTSSQLTNKFLELLELPNTIAAIDNSSNLYYYYTYNIKADPSAIEIFQDIKPIINRNIQGYITFIQFIYQLKISGLIVNFIIDIIKDGKYIDNLSTNEMSLLFNSDFFKFHQELNNNFWGSILNAPDMIKNHEIIK